MYLPSKILPSLRMGHLQLNPLSVNIVIHGNFDVNWVPAIDIWDKDEWTVGYPFYLSIFLNLLLFLFCQFNSYIL